MFLNKLWSDSYHFRVDWKEFRVISQAKMNILIILFDKYIYKVTDVLFEI